MMRFLLRRSLTLLATVLAASAVIFAALDVLPGNIAQVLLGPDASQEAVQALAQQLGLDQPAWQRYTQWLGGLLRFDLVYHGLFKCNQRTIASYPQLSNYLRELYQYPKVAETINVAHFVRGYYSIPGINPTGIIPRGPQGYHEALAEPHDRGRFGSPAEH